MPQSVARAEPKLSVDVQPQEINLGEAIQVRLTVLDQESTQLDLMEPPDLRIPPLKDFVLQSQTSSQVSMYVSGAYQLKVEAVFNLEPVRSGEIEFPSLTLSYRQKGQSRVLVSKAIKIQVSEIKPTLKLKWWAVLGLLAVPIFWGVIWFLGREKRTRPVEQFSTVFQREQNLVAQTGHQRKTLRRLDHLYEEYVAGLPAAETLEQLYAWFRDEAGRAGYLPTSGATATEIIHFLEQQAKGREEILNIANFLELCHSLRYSGSGQNPSKLEDVFDLAQKIRF